MRTPLLAAGACVLLLPLVAAPAASAHSGGPPGGEPLVCATDNYVKSCFEQNGDDFWVYDAEKDGRSAYISFTTSRGGSGSCRNSHGYGTWHECTFDMHESNANGTPNRVTWRHYTYDAQTNDYNYISGPYSAYVSSNPSWPV